MGPFWSAAIALVAAVAAYLVGYTVRLGGINKKATLIETEAETLLRDANSKAKEIELEARNSALRIKEEAESEARQRQQEVAHQEDRLQQRRENLDRRFDALEARQHKMEDRKKSLDLRQQELDSAWEAHIAELERISAMSRDEAREVLLQRVEDDARIDAARIMREIEAEARETADKKAEEIVLQAIQRVATDVVADRTVSTVELPNDEMKGRIIGRGGRNIRAIENITGVDLVIDDTPEAVLLSSFDPVRREVARIALTRLISDGRIHPARIESTVEKARQEVETVIREEGERAAYDLSIHQLPKELLHLLGRLKYRTSYGQNVLKHSIETAQLCAVMAAELEADVEMAKTAGLLHDIGKAVDHEVDGPHAIIGAEIAKRHNLPDNICNAIGSHHGEMEQLTMEAVIVQVADAISAARPGARRESLENYIKRIKSLEQVANSFEGVDTSYAIQAGREVRIIVKPDQIDDLAAMRLSKDIARKVEESLQYPGQIKITVIRETRASDIAK